MFCEYGSVSTNTDMQNTLIGHIYGTIEGDETTYFSDDMNFQDFSETQIKDNYYSHSYKS